MLVQIYEISSPEEAKILADLGVDHIGVLVGNGEFPREQSIGKAKEIFAAIPAPAKGSALSLSADLVLIERIIKELNPPILHLGASTEILKPEDIKQLKTKFASQIIMRSIPVVGEESIVLAKEYDGTADILLLDSHIPGDKQIGALGKAHDWDISRRIVEFAKIPVILAGGLGPENVEEAIHIVRPTGVDSKTKTDKTDESHTKDVEKVRRFVEIAKSPKNPIKTF